MDCGVSRRALVVVLFLSGACLSSGRVVAQRPTVVRLQVPPWVSGGRCTVRQGAAIVVEQHGREQAFECPGRGRVVECDLDGAEPVDFRLDTLCRTPSVSFRRAEAVSVGVSVPAAVKLEWLNWRLEEEPVVVATRTVAANLHLQIPVTRLGDRFIRFSRPGASPVTVQAGRLMGPSAWVLPAPVPGGEIVARASPATVLPTRYSVSGPSAVNWDRRTTALYSIVGARPGNYRVLPIYENGPTGKPVVAAVREGFSTALSLRPEQVGGVRVAVDRDVCTHESEVVILRQADAQAAEATGIQRTWTPRTEVVARVGLIGTCEPTVAGLQRGRFDALVKANGATVAAASVDVAPQQWSGILLSNSRTTVSGRVLLNQRPLSGVELSFSGGSPRGATSRVVTDSQGSYNTGLPAPGRYVVTLSSGSVRIPRTTTTSIAEGPNSFDWEMEGGVLTIRTSGWDRLSPLELSLSVLKTVGATYSSSVTAIPPDSPEPIELAGLSFGTYRVSAGVHKGASAKPVQVSLDEKQPQQTIDLELTDNPVVLRVRDEAGSPISGVLVTGANGATEVQPGEFVVRGAPPGTSLGIRIPGFVPTCRVTPKGGDVDVIAQAGRVVQFESDRVAVVSGAMVLSVAGADCPVPLSLFSVRRQSGGDGQPTRWSILNFPLAEIVSLQLGTEVRRIQVPSGEIITIKTPD